MADWYLLIKRSKCSCCTCSCVAMYKYHIGLRLLQYIAHTNKYACGYIIEILSLLHDVEVVIRSYFK